MRDVSINPLELELIMSEWEKELEAFLIKIGQIPAVAPKPASTDNKEKE